MKKYFDSIADSGGRPVAGASILVKLHPSEAIASIFSDDGVTPASNPVTSDQNGAFSFYAADGLYSLSISGFGISPRDITGIELFAYQDENVWPAPQTFNASATFNGGLLVSFGSLTHYQNGVGVNVFTTTGNSDNTNALSHATNYIRVGGASGGDPQTWYSIDGLTTWAVGADNSDADKFKVSYGTALGTNDCFVIDSTKQVSFFNTASFLRTGAGASISTSDGTQNFTLGSDGTNIYLGASSASSGLRLTTGAQVEQVRVLHMASANNYLTFTGSNGGYPAIGNRTGSGVGINMVPDNGVFQVVNNAGASSISGFSSGTNHSYLTLQNASTGVLLQINGSNGGTAQYNVPQALGNAVVHTFYGANGGSTNFAINQGSNADTNYVVVKSSTSSPSIYASSGSLVIGSALAFTGQTVGSTVGASGGASALPATPLGYVTTSINGISCKIPYYN